MQYSPNFPVEEQVVSIWLGTAGQLDDVAVGRASLETELLEHLRRRQRAETIRETGKFEDDTEPR